MCFNLIGNKSLHTIKEIIKIGFGGGCHWCTEAVFQHLIGVEKVQQGWVASNNEHYAFSEAVIVYFNPKLIPLKVLVKVHLYTHKSTSDHSMRKKYRSGVYTFTKEQEVEAREIIQELQEEFNGKLITKVYPFRSFKPSTEQTINYYKKNPKKTVLYHLYRS